MMTVTYNKSFYPDATEIISIEECHIINVRIFPKSYY